MALMRNLRDIEAEYIEMMTRHANRSLDPEDHFQVRTVDLHYATYLIMAAVREAWYAGAAWNEGLKPPTITVKIDETSIFPKPRP